MASANQNIKYWQIAMRTLCDSAMFLFNNKTMSDVTFVFKNKNSATESTEEIHAHSWILSMLSPVFYDSFKNNFEVSKQIPVSETTYEGFLECLRFIYTSGCILTEDNALEVMKVAKKYSLKFLEEDCADFIIKSVTLDSACVILDNAIRFKHNTLKDKLLKFIAPNIGPILETNSFLDISKESLEEILIIEETGPITEMELFSSAVKWATQKCISNKMTVNGSNKRVFLGNLIKHIGFSRMTPVELSQCIVQEEGILTNDEERSLLLETTINKCNDNGFRKDARKYIIDFDKVAESYMPLFDTIDIRSWKFNLRGFNGRSKFTVNKPVNITSLFFATTKVTQKVSIQLLDDNNTLLHNEKLNIALSFGTGKYYRLSNPVQIIPNREYIIDIKYDNTFCKFPKFPKMLPQPVNGVEFHFSELSELLYTIYFKQLPITN